MCTVLREILEGDSIPSYDEDDNSINLNPDSLDINKFDRGKKFFQKNVGQCLIAMLYSLVCGLSIKRFLDVLVCTGRTSTPENSIKRYLNTTMHVLKWHYGNVWDSTSKANHSICSVRNMHKSARILMTGSIDRTRFDDKTSDEKREKCVYISQYDMGLVQCGFMGAIIMYPDKFGIRCSQRDLDDYVYFWRWIGYLLGIDDKYNICIGGYYSALEICKAIDKNILLTSLADPPPDFYPMAKAFTDGTKLISYIPCWTVESIVARYFHATGNLYPHQISCGDWTRIYFIRSFLASMYYFSSFASFINAGIELSFQRHKIT
ncbi:hypothetical protein ACF0H5_003415 [Mactra antiquata]